METILPALGGTLQGADTTNKVLEAVGILPSTTTVNPYNSFASTEQDHSTILATLRGIEEKIMQRFNKLDLLLSNKPVTSGGRRSRKKQKHLRQKSRRKL